MASPFDTFAGILERYRKPYRRLRRNHIRVLKLLPAKQGDELCGILEHIPLPAEEHEAEPPFEAISYAWGSSEKPHHIRIRHRGTIKLTVSLEQALRHFRDEDGSRYLWADAVCIDQDNLKERSQQVAIMAQIFAASRCVLVWLGLSHDAQVDAAMINVAEICDDLFNEVDGPAEISTSRISERLEHEYTPERRLQIPEGSITGAGDDAASDDPYLYALDALRAIWQWLGRPYFGRLWVVQEDFSARHLWFCSDTFTLRRRTFSSAVYALQDNWDSSDGRLRLTLSEEIRLNDIAKDLMESGNGPATRADFVLEKLIMYSMKSCVDPRDRIFAIRNVLSLEEIEGLRPDYTITPATLYRTLMQHLLANTWLILNPSLVLALASPDSRIGGERLPSWTPNLHQMSMPSRAKMNTYRIYPRGGHRCHDRRARVAWEDDCVYLTENFDYSNPSDRPHALMVKGRLFGHVTEPIPVPSVPPSCHERGDFHSSQYHSFEEFQDWYDSWHRYFGTFFESSTRGFDVHKELMDFLSYPTHWSSELDVLTGVADRSPDGFWERYLASRPDFCGLPEGLAREFQYFLLYALSECPLIRQRRGWQISTDGRVDLAWLPEEAQSGDTVCVFAGAMWPFVVRPVGDGEYWLIGDCHTYSTPLIEAVGGIYDESEHGDGHTYNYLGEKDATTSGDAVDRTSAAKAYAGLSNQPTIEAHDSEPSLSDTDDVNVKTSRPSSPAECLAEGEDKAHDAVRGEGVRTSTDGDNQEDVQFRRGECLAFNMPGLRYDDLIKKMEYIPLV